MKRKVETPFMANFVKQCELRGLPFNIGKEVRNAAKPTILGDELNGSIGMLWHSRDKGVTLCKRVIALLSMREVPQASPQHYCPERKDQEWSG